MTSYFEIVDLIRSILRKHAFENSGYLPPTRLSTLAFQLAQLFTEPTTINPTLLGFSLSHQGLGLRSLQAVCDGVRSKYLALIDEHTAELINQQIKTLIESFNADQELQHQQTQTRLSRIIQQRSAEEQNPETLN